MSFQALNAAISGLQIAQQQLSVISNNVANVGTEGYTRKILPQSSRVLQSTGEVIGVRSELIIRNVDMTLARDLWTQVSAVSALDVKAGYLNRISTFHGPPQSEISIAAELSELKDTFAGLADEPNNVYFQRTTLQQAEIVAKKFNDYSNLINDLRNDAQNEMESVVGQVNGLLTQISDLNQQIRDAILLDRPAANLQDVRDLAIKELSELMEISFYEQGNGVTVVQTSTGVLLADDEKVDLFFNPTFLGPTASYPDSAAPVYSGGDPRVNPGAIDLTRTDLGGKLGGLIELRDEIFPQYQAQIDELAHKVASRFEDQGLRLFTGTDGFVPLDTPPDIGTDPVTPVAYVGFSSTIRVNSLIQDDPTLLQSGTYTSDSPLPVGSSEVIDRILEFTFGEYEFQEAVGTVDITIASSGSADLQQHLGLYSTNQVVIGPDLTQYTQIDSVGATTSDLITALSQYTPGYPADDEFRIQLTDRNGVAIPTSVNIDLSTLGTDPLYAIGGADPSGTLPDGQIDNALDQIVAFVNATIIAEEGLANIPTDLQARASINQFGQFVFTSRGDVAFNSSGFPNALGDNGFQAIFGVAPSSYSTEHPYFDVQVGSNDPVRITIEPGEDENDLLAKLEKLTPADAGVSGLFVDDAAFALGNLTLRPGQDETGLAGPDYGGALRLIAGPTQSDGTGVAPANATILESLFGSADPITSVAYGSEISQNLGVGSGTFTPFRSQNLGQNTAVSTGLSSSPSLLDFAQKLVTTQTQDLSIIEASLDDEGVLKELLETRLLNESGVNIDEELSNLILVQNAYAAAARTITAVDEMFQELLNAVQR